MFRSALVSTASEIRFVQLEHSKLHETLGGSLQIVGCVGVDIVALGLEDAEGAPLNPFVFPDGMCEPEVRGDILLVGVDADGNGVDIDETLLESHMQRHSTKIL